MKRLINYSIEAHNHAPLQLIIFIVIILSIFGSYQIHADKKPSGDRPASWAVPIESKVLNNFFKVSDTLYRGAQPKVKGFEDLKKLGIKTIVNFRDSDYDSKIVSRFGFEYIHIPMNASSPKKWDFQKFLEIAADPSKQPVFVHCLHGADRTGTAVALYRIKIQKWDREDAIKEMVYGGFGFHGVYSNLKSFIRNY